MSGTERRNPHHKKRGRHPPSAQTLDDTQVQYDPHFIQQHPNAARQFPRNFAYSHRRLEANAPGTHYDGTNPADSRLYMNSQTSTVYNSPGQDHLQVAPYNVPEFQGPYHNPYNLGVGIQYDGYDSSMYDPSNGADYHTYSGIQQPQYEQLPGSAYYNHQGTIQTQYPVPAEYYTNTPPTPAASDQIGDRKRRKGSNRPVASHRPIETPRLTPDDMSHSSRASRRKSSENSMKSAKQSKTKKGKRDVPELTAPLSELTKSYHHIPLKDMDAWVNRSVETRLKECGKKEGWIPRPMNSFMLYRSAYAERTKHWCLQNNHQVVSSVSGTSWPMEPLEIRERFIEWARQERENHAKAHPGYKFSPAKTDASRRKRKGGPKEPDDDESADLEELDVDWQPSRSSRNRKRNGRAKRAKTAHNAQHPVNVEFQVEYGAPAASEPSSTEQSTYEFNNPGKVRPPQLDNLQHGEYYQAIVDSNFLGTGRVEDVSFLKAEAPHSHNEPKEELVGLPGADHHELLLDPQLSGDNVNLARNPDIGVPLDPHLDPSFFDFDFEQLGELDSSLCQTILKSFDQTGILDMSESKTEGPHVGDNQYEDQNQDENGHPKGAQSNENGYQNVYRDAYRNQRPEEVEDEQPNEFPSILEQTSIPNEHGLKPDKEPGELNDGKLDDENLDDELFGDDLFGDDPFGDEKRGDEESSDEKPGHEKPDHKAGNNEKPPSAKKRSR